MRARLVPAVAALAAWATFGLAADAPSLPAPAAEALQAFRNVPWNDRVKRERPDPAPDGWQERLRAEWALAALPPASRPALEALLGDGDRFVRALGAQALGLAGDAAATPALAAAVAKEKDKLARVAMVEALARTGGDGALAAVEAQQPAGGDADVAFVAGLARRQLKGGRWDVVSLRAEFLDAPGAALASAKVGAAAPEIALPSAEKPVNLSTFRGKIVVLAFTHGDRGEDGAKVLQRLGGQSEELARLGVEVVVVAPHEKERVRAWADRMKLPFTFAADPSGRAQGVYGVARQLVAGGEWMPSPAWFVIDRKGLLVWRKIGRRADEHATLGDLLPVLENVSRGIALR